MSDTIAYVLLYILIFLYGIVIGSFSNVCILRLPAKESIVPHSHCMTCGYHLRWYDMVPVFSYLVLRGRCRKCGEKISPQYPIVEAANGVLYVLIFLANGFHIVTAFLCLCASALIILSVIDFRTYEIPNSLNVFIAILGVLATITDQLVSHANLKSHLIGMVVVSVFLLIIYLVSAGRGIGGGDIKLMAAAGLLIGTKEIVVAFLIGCIAGSIIHVIRMKVSHAEHVLALGPYLSVGILVSMFAGEYIANWYLHICGLI